MMAPILKELKTEYAAVLNVEFIDVWKNPDAGKPYKIKLIPTQIFFDASGKERFRHEGFFGKEDILAKWKELGVDLKGKAATGIVRETPVAADSRSRDTVCYMCDGNIDPKAKVVVKGGGPNLGAGALGLPPLPLALPARMQLQGPSGACWEAVYSSAGVTTNIATEFGGKAD
jgi:thiol-disulfide isomerase/thioredoxin